MAARYGGRTRLGIGRVAQTALASVGLALQSTPMALAQLADVDPVLNAAVEALVTSDPEVANNPELAQLCRNIAEATVLDPRERAAVTNEVASIQREGIDINTVIPSEVRETARTQFTEWQSRTQGEMETLRATNPEMAKERELMLREGERAMRAFESGERYTPSTEMVDHAKSQMEQWSKDMLDQGVDPRFVEMAQMEFTRWSGGENFGPRGSDFNRGPGTAGYDTGAAKELATKLGVDPSLNLNDPGVVDKLMRDGKLSQDTLAKAMAEMGQAGQMDGRLGEMARTYFGGSEGHFGPGAASYDTGAGNKFAQEFGVGNVNLNDPSVLKDLVNSGQITEEQMKAMWEGGDTRLREGLAAFGGSSSGSGWESSQYTSGWESSYMGTSGPSPYGGEMPSGWAYDQSGNYHFVGTEGMAPTSGGSFGEWPVGDTMMPPGGFEGYVAPTAWEGSYISTGETYVPPTTEYQQYVAENQQQYQQNQQDTTTQTAQERYETAIHFSDHNNDTVPDEHVHTIHVHTDGTRHDHTATSPADTAPGGVYIP